MQMTRAKMIKTCGAVMGVSAIGAYVNKWDSGASTRSNVVVASVEFVRLCAVSVSSIFLVAYIWRQQLNAAGKSADPGRDSVGGGQGRG